MRLPADLHSSSMYSNTGIINRPRFCVIQQSEEYLDEFLEAYERVQHPEIDDILQTAMDRVNEQPYLLRPMIRYSLPPRSNIGCLCYQMSQLSVNGVFSCHAEQLNGLELPNHMMLAGLYRWLS